MSSKIENLYVLCLDSGTCLPLESTVLLDVSKLTEPELCILMEGSDMERSEMGDERGKWLPELLGLEPTP
jgi:hypothetical protein